MGRRTSDVITGMGVAQSVRSCAEGRLTVIFRLGRRKVYLYPTEKCDSDPNFSENEIEFRNAFPKIYKSPVSKKMLLVAFYLLGNSCADFRTWEIRHIK